MSSLGGFNVLEGLFTSVLRVPNLKIRLPSISLPGPMLVFSVIFLTYFLVLSGVVYDLIIEPPSVGYEMDHASGRYKPVTFMAGRVNGQYIVEGLSAGMLFGVGGLGFLALNWAYDPSTRLLKKKGSPSVGTYNSIWLYVGAAAVAVAYNLCITFLRIKVPGYLRT